MSDNQKFASGIGVLGRAIGRWLGENGFSLSNIPEIAPGTTLEDLCPAPPLGLTWADIGVEKLPDRRLVRVRIPEKVRARRRGRRPDKQLRVEAQMRAELRSGKLTPKELADMREKKWPDRYGVSRNTARKARDVVLSEF